MNAESRRDGRYRSITGVGLLLAVALAGMSAMGRPGLEVSRDQGANAARSGVSTSDAVQWPVSEGGNGHWYMGYGAAETDYETWEDASAIAQSLGGHLATCTTPEENLFVQIVRDTTCMWGGAWIGLLQSPEGQEPDGGWAWVTGEPLAWTNWSVNPPEPDNSDNDGNDSDYAEMCCDADIWGDWGSNKKLPYLIEWTADCNNDGIVDYGQILDGSLLDTDSDGVPDICECSADLDSDLVVSIHDLLIVIAEYGTTNPIGDANFDGIVDVNDILVVIASWGTCP